VKPGSSAATTESVLLMGYGWPDLGDPILSNCDIEGILTVFAWAFEGVDAYPSEVASVNCRD
jgi:hypothetical protein